MASGANLLILDDEDRVTPAHHSVRQWTLSRLTSPWNSGRTRDGRESRSNTTQSSNEAKAVLEIGEMLVSYLSAETGAPVDQTNVPMTGTQVKPGFMRAMMPIPGIAKMLFNNGKTYNLIVPERYSSTASSPRYLQSYAHKSRLFEYAQQHWMEHTQSISPRSKQWDIWCTLAVHQHGHAVYPWPKVGQSALSHLNGFLGWAIAHQHSACISLLAGSFLSRELVLSMEKNDFWNLPLPNHGNDPPLILAAKVGDWDMINRLSGLCNMLSLDTHGNTILHILSSQRLSVALEQEPVFFQILVKSYHGGKNLDALLFVMFRIVTSRLPSTLHQPTRLMPCTNIYLTTVDWTSLTIMGTLLFIALSVVETAP